MQPLWLSLLPLLFSLHHELQPQERDKSCPISQSVQFSSVTQSCLTLCNPMNCSTPGLPVHHQLTTAAKSLQSCLTLCDPIDGSQPTRLPCPWDSPGKNTGVGCHFRLQCMKVKNESEVAQSCPTLSDPMDCSLPGSFAHGIFEARVLEWGAIAFSCQLPEPTQKKSLSEYKKFK